MTAAPLHWLKKIETALDEAKQIPLFGSVPDFPWETFSHKIASALHLSGLRVSLYRAQFLKGAESTVGLGTGWIPIAIDITPLSGQVYWIMAKDEIAKLAALILTPAHPSKGFSSQEFEEGFFSFLATKALAALNAMSALEDLAPKIGKTSSVPMQESYCLDVEIQHPKHTLWGRLVCPVPVQQELKAHFSQRPPSFLKNSREEHVDVSLSVNIGQTSLSFKEWKGVGVGDLVLLDRCTFDPTTHKGTAMLTLKATPLFRARIKEDHLKIVDYALYREEQNPMNLMPDDEDSFEETFESEEPSPEEGMNEEHLWDSANGEHQKEEMIDVKDVDLVITVEVTRLNMSLDKLLQLAPGNILELPVKPEQGVDLTVNGKKVAKAELVKLGDALGVKILQIGR